MQQLSEWAKARLDPADGTQAGMLRSAAIGMLKEGFEYLPAVGQNYNHAYYNTHMDRFGLKPIALYGDP